MSQTDEGQQVRLRQARERLEKLSWLLDESFTLPGTNKRFGIDPILGLLPGVGDVIGAILSLYVVAEAARLGAPNRLLGRMGINVLVEVVVGLVPVAGDLFDFYWKANSRNRELLTEHIDDELQPKQAQGKSWLLPVLILLALLAGSYFILQSMAH